ncbi:MAG TPA: efflux RND transporter permease subunit [Flavobacteriales bacterium]|nr:efflux RND transporter permease subunit [Flavobacteriales bacterium]
MLNKLITYFLNNRLVTLLLLAVLVGWGIITAPFGWQVDPLPSDPVPVDAIPDIGENQQIVFSNWAGRSPQDIEDQVTYPLTTALLGIPGVKSIRSTSMFGFSSIYVLFDEDVEFYWSRSRILEKINALPSGLLPEGVQPALGPDATALGQVYWYTLEGRDPDGRVTGGWDLDELRSVQDFQVKYALNGVEGVSEVASIGGMVREYQVDVDPEALKAFGIGIHQVMQAVRNSNRDAGAKTIEVNQVEYLVRGLGYIRSVEDLEQAVVAVNDNVPLRIRDVARVTLGPATRRGLLDKGGAEVSGGVVIARYGANPLATIQAVKDKIAEIAPGLPSKVLDDGRVSQLTIVPFYDRTQLIQETLGTLEEALSLEVLITIIVILVMVAELRSSLVIASLLPLAVLLVFIAMRYFQVDANIVALSGIVIAIGTMVDLGIILSENVVRHLREQGVVKDLRRTIQEAAIEVAPAIVTAVSTTIVSFIPVFTLEAAEGKLFRPLAFTKTFALTGSVLVTLFLLPTFIHLVFGIDARRRGMRWMVRGVMLAVGAFAFWNGSLWAGITLLALLATHVLVDRLGERDRRWQHLPLVVVLLAVVWLLAGLWRPLGVERSLVLNVVLVGLAIGAILLFLWSLQRYYPMILGWCLRHKTLFLSIPAAIILFGLLIWQGSDKLLSPIKAGARAIGWDIADTSPWRGLASVFPGVGREFMPALDEGSFLLMPTSMPHAGVEQNHRVVQQLDMRVMAIPEVELVVGKLGRAETALDPAPISMYENIINYRPEYEVDDKGHRITFRTDRQGRFILADGDTVSQEDALVAGFDRDLLVPAGRGRYFRNWRPHIRRTDDIWAEVVAATSLPGVTSAPKLQPIETRLVMLQTGMRAPMGIKVFGPDLPTIERFGRELEGVLKTVPSVKAEAVFADRIVGKPYLQVRWDREAIARYGLTIEDLQRILETAIGGMAITTTVEGRERYPVRVRYPRELRDDPDQLRRVLVPTPTGVQVPLGELADVEYERGPQMIRSEDTFLVGYVLFDKRKGEAEVDVVLDAQRAIQDRVDDGSLKVPSGVSYRFSGSYENSLRAEKRLMVVVPLVLLSIFLILYFQFRAVPTSLMVFAGVAVAFSGGFMLIWLYGQDWFMNVDLFGRSMRDLFQIHPVNLSVAVWVGFIALFGVATDDGVLMATYLDDQFRKGSPTDVAAVRAAVVKAGMKRVRPAMMTTATTLIALLPVLTSTGRGSDIMVPMAIPSFGGMVVASITIFVVPVLYCARMERRLKDKRP